MEFINMIGQAKGMGLDIGGLVNLLIMYILLTRHFDKKFSQLIESEVAFKQSVVNEINEIKAHVGLKLKET